MHDSDDTVMLRKFAERLATELNAQGIEIPPGEYAITKVEKALRGTVVSFTTPQRKIGYRYHDKKLGVVEEPAYDPGFYGISPDIADKVTRTVRKVSLVVLGEWRKAK